jgi:hypothetical protein
MKLILFLLVGLLSSLFGSELVGKITLIQGIVKVKKENSIKKKKVSLNDLLYKGDMVITSRKSSAKIVLQDGSTLILDEKSTLNFHSLLNAEQTNGKILYKITSRDKQHHLKVKTPFAIIGIKGTTFVINAKTNQQSISLQEGLIGVNALHGEFKLYKKKVLAEFEAYKAKQATEFEAYKSSQNQYTKIAQTKSFDLKAGNKISFDGNIVKEDPLIQRDNEFKYFEKLLKVMH